MGIKLGVIMDPIQHITPYKDTSLAMLLAAQERGLSLFYMEMGDLSVDQGQPMARMRELSVKDDPYHWFTLGEESRAPLSSLNVILMRKDPPFNIDYIYATYVLELAEAAGVLVCNKPQSLRDANEKFFITRFADCIPPTLITCDQLLIKNFLHTHQTIVVKPLDGMGGESVFKLTEHDPNFHVACEWLTQHGHRLIMAQRFIPEIAAGDKRILMIDGEPVREAVARVPSPGDSRGNLVRGAKAIAHILTEREAWICSRVGPILRQKGLLFVGIDIIGDYLTEINVTSPTCAREIQAIHGVDVAARFIECIIQKVRQ